ncbi:peroxiredoxin-like family protein [Sphingomonas nostoxanthinifaciens]|uniref:peroxiredoxin-like family protein n=1 Tax=Sphingomonas nostoxanthinifaciens TaxID=2872652 RepID=UPI001CC1FDC2|nr:peroxiredoxin-like family protein [Sphingomonas nostoxanthinifaciens]UAK26290.1 AhpC/TSA family protein [Sphingomonas nostoxanthinifaciens]
MSDISPLASAFAALQKERAASWSAEALAAGAAQRRALVEAFDPARAVQVGDRLPDARLIDVAGGDTSLGAVVANGPAVLILFRYAGCPADNIALPIYDRDLVDALSAQGVPLVAISPQIPERLAGIRDRHQLKLTVASDPDNRLAGALGLVFTPLQTPAPPPSGWIGEVTGTGTWELPLTSVLIVDAKRAVRFVAVSPDWLDRIEPGAVRAALDAVLDGSASERAAA